MPGVRRRAHYPAPTLTAAGRARRGAF